MLVVVPFNVLGLLGVELLVPGLPMPFGLPSPVGLVDMLEPRARIGPLRPREPLGPAEFLRPDELRSPDAPDDDDAPVDSDEGDESDETDEPADDVGLQLTPGVMIDDGLVVLVDLVELVGLVELVELVELVDVVEPVAVVPVLPVVPGLPVVCANAGAVLKAIAHARHAPLRIGILRMLVKMFLLPYHLRSTCRFARAVDASAFTVIAAINLPISPLADDSEGSWFDHSFATVRRNDLDEGSRAPREQLGMSVLAAQHQA